MADGWNSDGSFQRGDGVRSGVTTWAQGQAAATGIDESLFDHHDNLLADGLEECLHRGGYNAMTDHINTGGYGFEHTAEKVGAFVNSNDSDPALGSAQVVRMDFDRADGTQLASIGFPSDAAFHIRSYNHGGQIVLEGEDSGGTMREYLRTVDRAASGQVSSLNILDGAGNAQPAGLGIEPVTNISGSSTTLLTQSSVGRRYSATSDDGPDTKLSLPATGATDIPIGAFWYFSCGASPSSMNIQKNSNTLLLEGDAVGTTDYAVGSLGSTGASAATISDGKIVKVAADTYAMVECTHHGNV